MTYEVHGVPRDPAISEGNVSFAATHAPEDETPGEPTSGGKKGLKSVSSGGGICTFISSAHVSNR